MKNIHKIYYLLFSGEIGELETLSDNQARQFLHINEDGGVSRLLGSCLI